jgi:hypothetical protein
MQNGDCADHIVVFAREVAAGTPIAERPLAGLLAHAMHAARKEWIAS